MQASREPQVSFISHWRFPIVPIPSRTKYLTTVASTFDSPRSHPPCVPVCTIQSSLPYLIRCLTSPTCPAPPGPALNLPHRAGSRSGADFAGAQRRQGAPGILRVGCLYRKVATCCPKSSKESQKLCRTYMPALTGETPAGRPRRIWRPARYTVHSTYCTIQRQFSTPALDLG